MKKHFSLVGSSFIPSTLRSILSIYFCCTYTCTVSWKINDLMYLSATQTDKFMIKMAFYPVGTGFLENDKILLFQKSLIYFFVQKHFKKLFFKAAYITKPNIRERENTLIVWSKGKVITVIIWTKKLKTYVHCKIEINSNLWKIDVWNGQAFLIFYEILHES